MLEFRNLKVIIFSVFVSLLLYLPAYSQSTAYITDEFGDSVCVVDLDTGTEIEEITIPGCTGSCDPYWIAASSDQSLVAASLHDDDPGVALIDPVTNMLITTVLIGTDSEPEAIAVNSSGTLVYVADEDNDELWVVDVVNQNIEAGPIDLNNGVICDAPENMVITPDDSTLFITCEDGGEVVSVATAGFALSQIALVGAHGIVIDPAGNFLYYGDGSDVFQYSIAGGALTGTQYDDCDFYNGATSPSGDRLYCVEDNDDLHIYNTASGDEIETVDLDGSNAEDVAVSCDGRFAYVPQDDFLEVVNTETFDLDTIDYSCGHGRGIVILDSCEQIVVNTPTLSEWGLLAMAGILGIIGLMVFRRRKITA